MRALFLLTVVVAASTVVIGCTCKPDENSGGDHTRGESVLILLDQVVSDDINPGDCDNQDWKYVEIKAKGALTVNVFWESEYAVGRAALYDKFGNKLAEKQHNATTEMDQLVIHVEPDPYFIVVEGTKHRSQYSVQAVFERE